MNGVAFMKTTDHLGRPLVAVTGMGRRHLAWPGQERQLGSTDQRQVGHPRDYALPHGSSGNAYFGHGGLPAGKQIGPDTPYPCPCRSCRRRSRGRIRPVWKRFRRPALSCSPSRRARLEASPGPLCALQSRWRLAQPHRSSREAKANGLFEETQFSSIADSLADKYGTSGLP